MRRISSYSAILFCSPSILFLHLVALKRREALQLHFQNRLRLALRELEASHQSFAGILGRLGSANQLDDGVEVRKRLQKAFQDMRALLSLAQIVLSAPPHHVHAVVNEKLDRLDQRKRARLAVDDGQHDHAEIFLKLRVLVEVVQDDFRLLASLDFDDHAHPVAVALVADVADALDFFILYEFRDALDDLGLVHLEGDFGDDNLLLVLGGPLDGRFGAHSELAAARLIGRADAAAAVKVGAGRKIRSGHKLKNFVHRGGGLRDEQNRRFNDFGQVVGWNLGRHPDGDAVRAVHQKIRNARGKDQRFFRGFVEIGDEIHGFLFDVGKQFLRDARQAAFRVPVGRRGVAVHRAEISLTVNQRIAHVEALRHAHQGVVNGRVAVRVIFLDDLADHARALRVALVGRDAFLVHRVEDAAMHGLQAVAHVGQRAPDDHAHRVVEIRPPHLVFDVDGDMLRRLRRCQFLVTHE